MNNICFLILHYNTINDTKKCVESIKKIKTTYCKKIVIVDNGSQNNTGKLLQNTYKDDESIDILINEKNLGFSRGNNIGYKFCKYNYNPKYIIVTNNDVIFKQKNMLTKLDEIYKRTKFHVYGPDIFSAKKYWHQSPHKLNYFNSETTIKYLNELKSDLEFYKNGKLTLNDEKKLNNTLEKHQNLYKIIKNLMLMLNLNNNNNYKCSQENIVLHGACIIFSNLFIDKFDKAFEPETFLYWEEDLLLLKCLKNNLKVIYDPSIQVLHMEEASTKNDHNDEVKKMLFKTTELIKSGNTYLEEVTKLENYKYEKESIINT